MFTGIIEQTGTLVSLTDRGGVRRITVEAPGIASRLREGDSLGVSGVCLTALDPDPTYFYADLAQETLDRTSLGSLAPGAKVNLELPTAAGSPLGGHVVQGHVDGAGVMTALDPVIPESSPHFDRQTTDWTLKVRVPENVRQWMVHKGSVAVEGISLTIAGVSGAPGDSALVAGVVGRRRDHHRNPAAHLLAHQSAHALHRRAHEHRSRCARQARRHANAGREKTRIRPHRRLARGQRVLRKARSSWFVPAN